MDATWKNRLQEYCQKKKISLPNYRIKNQSGPAHLLKFQVEVEVNGCWYAGDDHLLSKKDAEQSAAKKAWETLTGRNVHSISTLPVSEPSMVSTSETNSELQPSYSEVSKPDLLKHLPEEYADIEQFIADKVRAFDGRIHKIVRLNFQGQYKFEINGPYRYCENVKRQHKKNHIYFIVDPIKKTYVQKCHDPDCYGFRSSLKSIENEQKTLFNLQENHSIEKCSHCQKILLNQSKHGCERCGEIFCSNCVCFCELCHDAIHCERCIESCFDCHDS